MIHKQTEIKWLNCTVGILTEKEIDRFYLLPFLAVYIDNVFQEYMIDIGWGKWCVIFGISINDKSGLL